MTRIINFADGFTSATEPSIEGLDQENYVIANNAVSTELFTINASVYKSAFFNFELIRSDDTNSYIESGEFKVLFYEGQWNIVKSISIGHEMFSSSIDEAFNVQIYMDTTGDVGSIKYNSGEMGNNYSGSLKISISRIVA
jgi:hypothetical protein